MYFFNPFKAQSVRSYLVPKSLSAFMQIVHTIVME